MGQCMVISAVFEPRGRTYHVDESIRPEQMTESQRARAAVPTVFAYGTPRTCEPLRRKGKVILQALFDHTRAESGPIAFASGASPMRSRGSSIVADSPPLPNQPTPTDTPETLSPGPHSALSTVVEEGLSNSNSPVAPIRSPPNAIRWPRDISNPTSPVLSSTSSTAHSAYSNISAGSFPSLAALRDETMFTADLTAMSRPPKIQAYADMNAARQDTLSQKFQISHALILPIYAHFLKVSKTYSPNLRQYVISESALASILRSKLNNDRMINRFFHIFARADGFGMSFEEFLMLLYSVSREASPEDKIWLSFKVCDFGQRQALGAPELANLLVTLLAQHGRALAEAEVAAIVKHTLQMGDLNRSGALEYDEFTNMMWAQLDFLALFTIDIASLFPSVDVVDFLVDTPLDARRRFSSPGQEPRGIPSPSTAMFGGGVRASPSFLARTRSPSSTVTASTIAPPDRPPSMSPPPRFLPAHDTGLVLRTPVPESATAPSPAGLGSRSAQWARRLVAENNAPE